MHKFNDTAKRILVSLIVISLSLISINHAAAGTVVVKPGQFDHFSLQLPEKIVAGENFIVKVQAYDLNKNLITNFPESGKEFRITVTGSASIQPSVLNAASFSGGTASISINCRKAERITFSIRESGGTVAVISRELIVSPNKLDHFVLQAPGVVTAGVNFDVRVVAKDVFDNVVDDLDIGRNIKVTSTGTSSIRMSGGSAFDFRNGSATASFVSEKAGDVTIELQEVSTGSGGKTLNIVVNPSALAYFKLQAPRDVVAGEAFELLVSAYDSFDNAVTNYSGVGSGVKLSTSGGSKVDPSFVQAVEFKNGQAVVKAVYEKAEAIQIIARESNKEQSGKTAEIVVANADPDHFVVVTPDSAVSGQKFKIKAESYDRFNNLVKNFNLIGNEIMLSTSGSGNISPARISPSEFTNGIAMVEVSYDKAESFLISATMSPDKVQGRITLKEHEKRKEVPHVKTSPKAPGKPSQEPVTKPKESKQTRKTVKSVEKEERKKPVKETPRKESAEKPVKQVKKETEEKRVETTKETKVIKPEKPATVTAKPDTTQAKPPVALPKTEPKTQKPAEEPKKPVEVAKKEEKKVEKPSQVYTVSNVSIIEAKNKAMLVINITNPNGHLEYSDEIESRYGKEWLKLRLNPAVRKTEKSFKFKSAYVGDVIIEESKEANVLNIFVELLPSGVTFDIARVKNTLVVTLAKP